MKKLIILLYLGVVTYAKPSYPIHPGVGAIYKGPNAETIIEGPDGSIITAEANGGIVGVNGEQAAVEAVAHSAAASAVVKSINTHQVIDQSAAAVAASAAAVSHSSLTQAPAIVQEPIAIAQPVVVAEDRAALDGPSGSILRQGENAIISGPASTTIREGKLIASIPKAEVNAIIAEPPRTLLAPQPALIGAPTIGINVAEANAHLADINLINEANRAALAEAELSHINSANAAALAVEADQVALAEQANRDALAEEANRAALIEESNRAAWAAEANRVALVGSKTHFVKTISPQVSAADINAINLAGLAHSQEEALARANLAQLSHGAVLTNVNAINGVNVAHSLDALARANLDAQLSLAVTPQVAVADVNTIKADNLASSQEAIARANLQAQLSHAVTQSHINAINEANLAHAQGTISQANLEAELAARARAEALNAEAERNALAAQAISRSHVGALNAVSLRPGLNPIITQGNQIISDAVISSTPAPVVEVTSISSLAPLVSTTVRPIIVSPKAETIISSTIVPTSGYVRKTLPAQNVIVSPTLSSVPGYLASGGAIPVVSHPKAVLTPVQTVDAGQVVYQRSSSLSSQSQSRSSSQSSSSEVLSSGLGGFGGPIVAAPVAVSTSDYAQWQESLASNEHAARESLLSHQIHRDILH